MTNRLRLTGLVLAALPTFSQAQSKNPESGYQFEQPASGKKQGSRLVLGDEQIEFYDWDNQALILKAKTKISWPREIDATLNGTKIYSIRKMDPIGAEAVNRPVYYVIEAVGRTVILLRGHHDMAARPRLDDPSWLKLATASVKEHFARSQRLREPRSKKALNEGRWQSPQISALHLTSSANDLKVHYQVLGHPGQKMKIEESLSWVQPDIVSEFGPKIEKEVVLKNPEEKYESTFSFAKIDVVYPKAKVQKTKGSLWRMTVRLELILPPTELAALPVEDQIHLNLEKRYGGPMTQTEIPTR